MSDDNNDESSDVCLECGRARPLDEQAFLIGKSFTIAELRELNRWSWFSFPLEMLGALLDAGFDIDRQQDATIKWTVHEARGCIGVCWVARHGERTAVIRGRESVDGELQFYVDRSLTYRAAGFDPISMGM